MLGGDGIQERCGASRKVSAWVFPPSLTRARARPRCPNPLSFPPPQPTRVDRGWFVFPFGKNPWWVYLASALPALLVTILIFMDQQITAVIVNRKEHKLRVSRDSSHARGHSIVSGTACVPASTRFWGADRVLLQGTEGFAPARHAVQSRGSPFPLQAVFLG